MVCCLSNPPPPIYDYAHAIHVTVFEQFNLKVDGTFTRRTVHLAFTCRCRAYQATVRGARWFPATLISYRKNICYGEPHPPRGGYAGKVAEDEGLET